MSKFLLVQTAVGDYRQKVLELVVERLGTSFEILTGEEYFESSTRTRISLGGAVKTVRNIFLFNRKVLIQPQTVLPALRADYLILEMNPRIINTWLILLLRKIVRRKTVLWGHAWPRDGADSPTDRVRNVMRRFGDHILVYTDTQSDELKRLMPDKSISSAPNALYSSNEMWVDTKERKNFIYVGRLVSTKKIALLIEAFSMAGLADFGSKLIIVGDGPELANCQKLCVDLGIVDSVEFKGHIANLAELRKLYEMSIASVSPGYVGLSITQSFSFGTPMIVANKENHSPEIEATRDQFNCKFFESNDAKSLSVLLNDFWVQRDFWSKQQDLIIDDCKVRYSAELMSSRIVEAFYKCKN